MSGAPAPETTPPEDRVTFAALRAAMPFDAVVFRAFWRVLGMLGKPGDVYTDPEVVARTQDVLGSLGAASAVTQPTRAELEAALGSGAGLALVAAAPAAPGELAPLPQSSVPRARLQAADVPTAVTSTRR